MSFMAAPLQKGALGRPDALELTCRSARAEACGETAYVLSGGSECYPSSKLKRDQQGAGRIPGRGASFWGRVACASSTLPTMATHATGRQLQRRRRIPLRRRQPPAAAQVREALRVGRLVRPPGQHSRRFLHAALQQREQRTACLSFPGSTITESLNLPPI